MLYGHVYDRALMPQVGMRLGGGKEIEPLSIWEWKGASPNYTRRMKRLMRIEGDGVAAIVKALQLDVGFPHEYMDVRFEILDERRAEFRLERLSHGALVAVLREFSLQTHLLASSADLHLSSRHERSAVREVLANQWAGANWVTAERIAAEFGLGGGIEGVAQLFALHPALPPGLAVEIEPTGEQKLRLALSGPPALLDPAAPGWLGLLAAGEPRPLEAIAQALEPRARVRAEAPHVFAIEVDPKAEPAPQPQSAALTRLSGVAAWKFRHF